MKITTKRHHALADLHTAVGLYLHLRDEYAGALLLESSDYQSAQNSSSFICLQPLSSFSVTDQTVRTQLHAKKAQEVQTDQSQFISHFQEYIDAHQLEQASAEDGFFGYIGYDAVALMEDVPLESDADPRLLYPAMHFALFRFVIHLNHFNDTMDITEYIPEGEKSQLDSLLAKLNHNRYNPYPFLPKGAISSNLTDEQYLEMVAKARHHCKRGDVFQLVLSRRFELSYQGDDFQVYRNLRAINPSPYGFYFDYGRYRIFGSSPESQLRISKGMASLNPIAGTYKRTGDDAADKLLAEKLAKDEKENAEHAMLVDLARNDLSRNCADVKVETLKEIQFFSHVIHLVSKVSGRLRADVNPLQVVADTFPAGTLSGAPKHRAMQLIDRYEPQRRGFYGGAVGFIGLDGSVNLAILIRSFLSKNNKLFFQAGAGIVEASNEANELQEVNNKLAALVSAINGAAHLNYNPKPLNL